ncbi:hypothetical protein ABC347_15885 [Sphingomonas sp. 1P06PA]
MPIAYPATIVAVTATTDRWVESHGRRWFNGLVAKARAAAFQ